MENATFYSFKPSGKWKYAGRGNLSDYVFRVFDTEQRRRQIIRDNGGKFPGMNGDASDMILVVIPDDEHETGFPLMLKPLGVL